VVSAGDDGRGGASVAGGKTTAAADLDLTPLPPPEDSAPPARLSMLGLARQPQRIASRLTSLQRSTTASVPALLPGGLCRRIWERRTTSEPAAPLRQVWHLGWELEGVRHRDRAAQAGLGWQVAAAGAWAGGSCGRRPPHRRGGLKVFSKADQVIWG